MLDINASKDNGVDVMRDVIAPRTHYKSITGEVQVILIDEADYLTSNAQASLRRIIEDAKNAQFIFVTNDLTKIINPLRDRCRDTTYHVLGVSDDEMRARINEIAELENMSNFDIDRIIDEADGSMRSAIKLLESYNNGSQYSFKTPTASLKDFMRGLKKVDIMSLLPCINADNLDNLARVILMNDKLTMEKRRAYVKFIADADIAIQHSHNADVHLINLIMNMKEC
jgi:DNA polymerase III delta prime subunit